MFKNVGSNWIANVVTLVVQLVLMRVVVRTLGVDLNGAWENVVTSTGFLTLLLLGVPLTSVRWFSQALAANDGDRLNRAIATCLGAYGILGLFAAVLSGFFFLGFEARTVPKIVESANLAGVDPGAVVDAARVGYALMTVTIAGGFVSQVPYAIMAAHRDFALRNVVMIGSQFLRLGATLALLRKEPTALVELGIVQVLCAAFEFAASAILVKRRYPNVRLGLKGFDRTILREILGFSVYVLLLNLGNKLMFQTSGLVVQWYEGSSLGDATVFEKAKSFVLPITEFAVSIGAVVMPTAIKLEADGGLSSLRDLMARWSKIALGVTLLPGLYLAVLGGEFFRAYFAMDTFDWRGAGRVQFILLLAHFLFWPVRAVALAILTGVGSPKRATIAFATAGAVNYLLTLALFPIFGLVGAAWATAAPLVLFSGYLLVLVCREIDMGVRAWARYVFGRAIVGSALLVAPLLYMKERHPPRTLVELVVIGVAYVVFFGVVWVFFVHRNDPHVDIGARLRARFGKAVAP
jgi:O-antigen/teichoic acid export membrane protein